VHGLDNMTLGVAIARKGWLEAADVLNTLDADGVLAFAAAKRAGQSAGAPAGSP
jgi:histidinol phosphatase-like PHP family hydrolase